MIPTRVLIAYASAHGSTREVAERIGEVLRDHGMQVSVMAARDVGHLHRLDAVILGGALYTGKLHRDARRFLKRHEEELAQRPLAVFALGPRTLDPVDVAASRTQVRHALERVPKLAPIAVEVFGGVIDPSTLHFPFKHMAASDARDWEAIATWAGDLAGRLVVEARTTRAAFHG
jgi:menaquinone-dependent protoporphyrinogen oxidase